MLISRRALLLGGAAAATGFIPAATSREPLSRDTLPASAPVRRIPLSAAEMEMALLGPDKPRTQGFCAYNGTPFFTLRAPQGTRLLVDFENRLPTPTTVHWHGIRVPYLSDGVSPLTQAPVAPGGTFSYNVPLPDPGFYFFHPHCDETGQVGRGLAGLLIVDDPAEAKLGFDLEHIIVVKDWRLDADGRWLPMFTDDGASTSGSFGTVRATNGSIVPPRVEAPAHGDVRLRVLVADSTRTIDFGCETQHAAIIAVDGQATTPPVSFSRLPDEIWRMGPAMRLDVHVRMPGPGEEVKVYDYRSAEPYLLTTLVAVDRGRRKTAFVPKALPAAKVPLPDVRRARKLDFLVQTAAGATAIAPPLPADDPLARALIDSFCVGDRTFWAINRTSWGAGADLRLPPPLEALKDGESYVLSITNVTKHVHPMHLHGHVFRVLSSSRRQVPPYLADTVMTEPNETVDIAFRATSGDWVFHCHILEHMDAGLMGWFRVT